jgi:hypothetical protein
MRNSKRLQSAPDLGQRHPCIYLANRAAPDRWLDGRTMMEQSVHLKFVQHSKARIIYKLGVSIYIPCAGSVLSSSVRGL